MTIKAGDRLPDVKLTVMGKNGPEPVATKDYFAGRRVALFSVPGAYTPTCHKKHLPGFIAKADEIKSKGVDAVAVTAVNDIFALDAWVKEFGRRRQDRRARRWFGDLRQSAWRRTRSDRRGAWRARQALFGADRRRRRQMDQCRGEFERSDGLDGRSHARPSLGAPSQETRTKRSPFQRCEDCISAATPGSVFPSSHSRKAPPAVDT